MFPVVNYRKRIPAYATNHNHGYCYPENYYRNSARVNVVENKDQFVVEVNAPGYQKEDFKLTVENQVLHLVVESAKDQKDKDGYVRREFFNGGFDKSFGLPESVDADQITAGYENGVLTVSIPKKEEAKAKPALEIPIK